MKKEMEYNEENWRSQNFCYVSEYNFLGLLGKHLLSLSKDDFFCSWIEIFMLVHKQTGRHKTVEIPNIKKKNLVPNL